MRLYKPVFIRRVVGQSMSPKLPAGSLLLATQLFRVLHPGEVVIIEHDGKQKVKRIERIEDNKLFVVGDNLEFSNDSRQFGWLEIDQIIAKVIWPNLKK